MSDKPETTKPDESAAQAPDCPSDERHIMETLQTIQQLPQAHKFWGTQPVPHEPVPADLPDGPIDELKKPEDIREEPLTLPKNYEWFDVDIFNDEQANQVYELLCNNYVEDDDNMFRFDYPVPLIRWAICPPNYIKEWHIGVRAKESKKLFGFITGIPVELYVKGKHMWAAEINFLCVHKALRNKRLAPVLIKEVTRRVNRLNGWQAIYTAGVLLPRPITSARYWHRSLNPVKLVKVGFSHLGPRLTLKRMTKLYSVPESPKIPGLRKIKESDMEKCLELFNTFEDKYPIHIQYTLEEFKHFFTPVDKVIDTYVIEDPKSHKIEAMCSFFYLPSKILKNEKYDELIAAYSYYNIIRDGYKLTYVELMNDCLTLAKAANADVFNALDIVTNADVFKECKFCQGDGQLQYYLYNWRTAEVSPKDIGVVLV